MAEARIRLLLVDDQSLFLEGLKLVLESRATDIDVVGTALDGREAIQAARDLMPDIILMDVRMPGVDGVEATREIHAELPHIRIVMLTTFSDDEYVHTALQDGAIGYLLKNRPPNELISAIRAVRDGTLQIDPSVAEVLLRKGGAPPGAEDDLESDIRSLTTRERDVLRCLLQALDNKQIARHLNVAEQTARNYISRVYDKLWVTHRTQLMRRADKILYYLDHPR